jgi:putative ABC transport system permease protein
VIGGTSTGVTLIVAISIINTSVLANFRRTIDLIAGPAALEVTLGVGEVGFREDAIDVVRADRDVQAAVPFVRGTITLVDDPDEALQLFGADLTAEEDLQRYQVTTGDRDEVLRGLSDPASVLLTRDFATRRSLRVGEAVGFSTPSGVRQLTIRGLLDAKGIAAAFGGQIAVMDLPAAQMLLGKSERVDQIDVILKPGIEVAPVQQRLSAALPDLNVMPPAQRASQYSRILGSFQTLLTALSLLCLVAGVFIVYNTTSTGVAHRASVMAWLRLVGADGQRLFWLLMTEALILGTIGTISGVPTGIVLARLLSGAVADSMGVIFQLRFPVDALAIDFPRQAAIALVGIAATVFASYFAARRVAAMTPLDVVRADLRSIGVQMSTSRLMLWWATLVVISAVCLAIEVRLRSIGWGNFGSTLWFASSIVIAVPLVRLLSGILSRVLPRLFGAQGRVAAASLFRSPTRTGVTAAAIALILTVAITFATLSYSHRSSISTYFLGGFLSSDLAVSAVSTEGGWLETPIPDSLVDQIATIPGVRSVDTFRILPGQIYRGVRIAVAGGSNGLADPARYPPGWYQEGDPVSAGAALRDATGVNISASLSDRFDLHVKDKMQLDTPSGPLTLDIVGVVPDYMSDGGSVILNRSLLTKYWKDSSVSRIHVFANPGVSLDALRSAIQAKVGKQYRLKVLSTGELVRYHSDMVNRAFALMDSIQLLIVIVTIAGIFDLLLSAIIERRRELGVWRVIGADERMVRQSVVLESATIGAIGAMLGIVVGAITAWIWVGINFRYLLGYYLDYRFAFAATAWYVALVLVTTVIAGWAAARQATRQPIVDAIQAQ